MNNYKTVPIGTCDSKFSPTSLFPFPLENPAIGDAGVGPSAVSVEDKTLRPDGSGDME